MSTQVTAVTMGMQLVKATGVPVLMSIRNEGFLPSPFNLVSEL